MHDQPVLPVRNREREAVVASTAWIDERLIAAAGERRTCLDACADAAFDLVQLDEELNVGSRTRARYSAAA